MPQSPRLGARRRDVALAPTNVYGWAYSWPLPARDLTTGIGCLFDGVDQMMQLDGGRKSRQTSFATANSLGEHRVHLADIERFAGQGLSRGDDKALGYLDRRQAVFAFGAMQRDLGQ